MRFAQKFLAEMTGYNLCGIGVLCYDGSGRGGYVDQRLSEFHWNRNLCPWRNIFRDPTPEGGEFNFTGDGSIKSGIGEYIQMQLQVCERRGENLEHPEENLEHPEEHLGEVMHMTAILPPKDQDAIIIYEKYKDVKTMLMQEGAPTIKEALKMIYKLAVDVYDLARTVNQTEWGNGVTVSTIEQGQSHCVTFLLKTLVFGGLRQTADIL